MDNFYQLGRGAIHTVEREIPEYIVVTLTYLAFLIHYWRFCANFVEWLFAVEATFTQVLWPFVTDQAHIARLYTTSSIKLTWYDFKVSCRQLYVRTYLDLIVQSYREDTWADFIIFVEHWLRSKIYPDLCNVVNDLKLRAEFHIRRPWISITKDYILEIGEPIYLREVVQYYSEAGTLLQFIVWLVDSYCPFILPRLFPHVQPWWFHVKALFFEKGLELLALASACLDFFLQPLQRVINAFVDLCLWPLRVIWRIVKFYFRLYLKVTCFCIECYIRPIFFVLHVVGRVVPRVEQAVANMEAKAEDLLTALKNPNLSIDTKLNYLLALKSDIKQKVVPAYLTPHLFHGIRLAITSQHSPIYVAGFSTLGHLLKRLYLQEQHGDVAYYARDLYSILLERLGDHKERVRTLASQAFTDLWPAANAEVEKHVLGTALNGKNPKAKEMSMLWLTLMSKEHGVLFRAHVPSLVVCLEDADSAIRETAKTTVVELFKNAPIHAKLNLKTEMTDRHVRKSIMNAILPLIGLDDEDHSQRPASRAEPSRYRAARLEEERSSSRMGPRPVSKAEPRPVSRVEQRPVSRVEQRPVSRVEQRPVSRVEQRPVAKVEQPTSVVEERPASRVEKRPVSRVEQRPVAKVEQPTSVVEERPASRVEQRPVTKVEQPTSVVEERPASRVEQHPPATVQPQPTSITEQRMAHRVEQLPVSKVEQQTTSEMAILSREQIRTEHPHVQPLMGQITAFDADDEPVTTRTVPRSLAENEPLYSQAAPQTEKLAAKHSHNIPHSPESDEDDSPKVQPQDVYSAKELESIIRSMAPYFEGRETEDNWVQRDTSVNLLRRLTAGNAPHDYPQVYVASIKSLIDGVFKVVNSLRTQLATTGCYFIQEMAKVCGSQIDPLVEPIMQNMLKICSGMKKITAGLGNTTVDTLLLHVSYNSRLLQHVAGSFDDKSMQLRLYAAGWLKTLINKQAHNKSSMEHNGGMDLMVKSLKKGLSDANPGVREAMRSTFWAFARVWPARSERLLADLDKKTRTLLEKDPSNPRNEASASQPGSAQRRQVTSGSTTPGRSALKQAIAARRKAHQQTAQPLPRPGSAHAVLIEPRPEPAQPEPRSTLSSAPVRRGVKVTRPATAEPGRRPAPNEGRPNQARVVSRWHPSSPTRAAPASGPAVSPPKSPPKAAPKSPAKSPSRSSFKSLFSRSKNLDLSNVQPQDARDGENRSRSNSSESSRSWSPSKVRFSLRRRRSEDNEVEDKEVEATDAAQPENLVTSWLPRAEVPEDAPKVPEDAPRVPEDALKVPEDVPKVSEDAPEVPEDAPKVPEDAPVQTANHIAIYEDPDAGQPENQATLDVNHNEQKEATTLSSPTLMPNHVFELPIESDTRGVVLTYPEKALGDLSYPTQKIRRITHEGPLDTHDPLTRRWKLIENTIAGRRNVKPEYADLQYARRLIATAKNMMQTHTETIDSYPYRKVQSLIAHHTDLFIGEHQFKEFLSLLLEELVRNPGPLDDARKQRAAMDYKTQVLKAVRFMFVYHETWYANLHADILMANMKVRRYFEPRHFIYKALNEAADDLLYACKLSDLVTAMVRNLNLLPDDAENLRGIMLAVRYITKILMILNRKGNQLEDEVLQDVGRYVMECLSNGRPEVRRMAMELSRQIRIMAGSDVQFWWLMGTSSDPTVLHMINYYVYRKPLKVEEDDDELLPLNYESDSELDMMCEGKLVK